MRRIFLVIQQMFERMIEAIKNDEIDDKNICKEFHTIDLNIDRLVDYCCRILNKIHSSFSDSKKMLLFSTLYLLELMADEFKYAGKHVALSKKSMKEILPLIEMIKEHFETYYHLFYKFDRENAIELGKNDYRVYNEYVRLKDNLKGESKKTAAHFMSICKFVFVLAELRIEMEY